MDNTENQSSPRDKKAKRGSSVGSLSRILITDSSEDRGNRIEKWLRAAGYRIIRSSGETDAIAQLHSHTPDLLIVAEDLPRRGWKNICRETSEHPRTRLPVLLLCKEKSVDWRPFLKELGFGEPDCVNDFLIWPMEKEPFLAKLEAILQNARTKHELLVSNTMLKELTDYLDNLVESKVLELENANRLRRFFSPQIVEAILSEEDTHEILREHRSEITIVFLDLRDFTAFSERHTPSEVISLVRDFHKSVGPIIFDFGGTLERFTGDGLMVFLGDPKPMEDHPYQAVRMALQIQRVIAAKKQTWNSQGYNVGLGIGVATGKATLGTIGFEGRYDYAAIGSVTNLAARLCSRAKRGQTLISEKTHEHIIDRIHTTSHGRVMLKGFLKPSLVYSVDDQSAID